MPKQQTDKEEIATGSSKDANKEEQTGDKKQFLGSAFKVNDIDSEERTVTAVISTDAIDRDDEVLLPKGADLENFKKNPVVLWSHNSSLPPIGKALWIERKGKKIIAKVQFAMTELAEDVWQLFKGGFLKAFSVGFMPKEPGRAPTPADLKRNPELANARRIFADWELLEFSPVSVPANPEALATAIKEGTIHLSYIKDFDIEEEEIEKEVSPIEIEKRLVPIKRIVSIEKVIPVSIEKIAVDGFSEAMKKHKGQVY